MDNNPNIKAWRVGVAASIFIILSVLWYVVFNSANYFEGIAEEQFDEKSQQTYNLDEIGSSSLVNPNSPYFVGFEALGKYGLSFDEEVYIRDAISTYVINNLKVSSAKISYLHESFRGPVINGADAKYTLKYYVNDIDEYALNIVTNQIEETVDITITEDTKVVFSKKFEIFRPL